MHVYLKIKIKSLANEAADIRKEKQRINLNSRARKRLSRDIAFGQVRTSNGARAEDFTEIQLERMTKKLARSQAILRNPKAMERQQGLYQHLRDVVRPEARASYIAYGFLRGRTYSEIEENSQTKPDWEKVQRLIEKFAEVGSQVWKPQLEHFMNGLRPEWQ